VFAVNLVVPLSGIDAWKTDCLIQGCESSGTIIFYRNIDDAKENKVWESGADRSIIVMLNLSILKILI